MRYRDTRPLNPGLLRHQIAWRRNVVTGQDSFGQDDHEWQLVTNVKAEVTPLDGREKEAAQQRWTEAQYHIRQHYVPGMDRAERGDWNLDGVAHTLQILDVQDPDGMGRSQVIIAKDWVL